MQKLQLRFEAVPKPELGNEENLTTKSVAKIMSWLMFTH
jgi:hypothetical protein